MIMDGAFEKKIFKLWEDGRPDLAKQEVYQYRMRYYDKLVRVEDRIFLDYRMALHSHKEGNVELANSYLKILKNVYDDEYTRKSCECEYYKYRWLYVNVNEKNIDKKDCISIMLEICNYYTEIGNQKMLKLASCNIFKFEEDESRILETIKYVLENGKYLKVNFLNSILEDCEKINRNLYIKASELVDRYKFNIDVV